MMKIMKIKKIMRIIKNQTKKLNNHHKMWKKINKSIRNKRKKSSISLYNFLYNVWIIVLLIHNYIN